MQIFLACHNAYASLFLTSITAGYAVGFLTTGLRGVAIPCAPFLDSPVKHHISFGKQFALRIAPSKLRHCLS